MALLQSVLGYIPHSLMSKIPFVEFLFFLECIKLLGEKWCLLVVVEFSLKKKKPGKQKSNKSNSFIFKDKDPETRKIK